ncbi:MAG: O-methyltransferase [Aggregatilineales bacterium]
MTQQNWTAVDDYFESVLVDDDPILNTCLKNSIEAGLPQHQVSATQGKFLMLLAQMQHAKRILEFGTLGGYSTIWLARALPPQGTLISLEFSAHHADIARKNIAHAGLDDRVMIHTGAALDTLPELVKTDDTPFDLIFIDADKPNNPHYLEWALRLSRVGTIIIVDNVVRGGAVVHADSTDANVQGVRALMTMLADEKRVEATALQTVGNKGYDGFALLRVIA